MIDEKIKFETALLAKEKGFNIAVQYFYGYKEDKLLYHYRDSLMNHNNGETEKTKDRCSAPTQSLLQRWLREEHGIQIFIKPDEIKNKMYYVLHGVYSLSIKRNFDIGSRLTLANYEQVLEIGLKDALNLI